MIKPITLAVDYETYYKSIPKDPEKYSLRVMGTEEYILDRRFQCHGAAVSVDHQPAVWMLLPELKEFFASLNWKRVVFVSHNCYFDAAITLWRYGYIAGAYIDTMGLANYKIRPFTGSSSLDSCAKFHGWPLKSGILKEVNGLRTEQIIAAGLMQFLGEYACDDCMKSVWLKQIHYRDINPVERIRMDWAVRNSIRGRMRIDMAKMHQALITVTEEREKLLAEAGIDAATARSRDKFADHLRSMGIEVELKTGKNGAEIPAIAKNDPFVSDMLTNAEPAVVAAMRCRLAFASTIEVSRAERLLRMGRATNGKMLFPTVWHGAHTGRPSGTDGVNPLNFRKATPDRPALIREAIVVLPGYVLLDADASQIEARFMVCLARCRPLIEVFEDTSRDVYCEVASTVFGREVTPDMEFERQVGKVTALSAQYGVGGHKTMMRLQAIGINISEGQAREYIGAYREGYPEILGNGKEFVELMKVVIYDNVEIEWKGCLLTGKGIQLPSKRWLYYDMLRVKQRGIEFYSHRYKSWQSLHPGFLNENLCQAMVNDHVGKVQAEHIDDCIGMVYDSLILNVEEERAGSLSPQLVKELSTPSSWMMETDVFDYITPPLSAKCKPKYSW